MILKFYTGKGCAPCKAAKPHVKQICEAKQITIHEINRDLQPGIAFADKVRSVPTFVLCDDSEHEMKRMEGFGSINTLKQFFEV